MGERVGWRIRGGVRASPGPAPGGGARESGERWLDGDTRAALAKALRDRAGVTLPLQAPEEIARRAGYHVSWVMSLEELPGEEEGSATVITCVWDRSPAERGLRVYCGLSRKWLLERAVDHTWDDVWRFALELPSETHRSGPERLIRSQPNCPEAVIRKVLAGRWG